MNLKSGKWIGHKAKVRVVTPRTGATAAAREWIAAHVAVDGTFETAAVQDALSKIIPHAKISEALARLRRQGEVECVIDGRQTNSTLNRRLK